MVIHSKTEYPKINLSSSDMDWTECPKYQKVTWANWQRAKDSLDLYCTRRSLSLVSFVCRSSHVFGVNGSDWRVSVDS